MTWLFWIALACVVITALGVVAKRLLADLMEIVAGWFTSQL